MKRLMAYVLSFGLVLLGTSPVLAAGEQAKAGTPALQGENQVEAVQVVMPQGKELSSDELVQIDGQFDPWLVGSGVITAKNGFQSAVTAAESNNVLGVFVGMGEFLFGVAMATWGVAVP